ncbi:MAG: hypothetical protein EXR52_08055 [Dehalococcoidia bacterium]|nr:hypothetical protein [Dehalococcoidia bacterium]
MTFGAAFSMDSLILDQVEPAGPFTPRGIENKGGIVSVIGSTLQRITSPLWNRPGGTLTVSNTTLLGNREHGLYNQGLATVTRSLFTITSITTL